MQGKKNKAKQKGQQLSRQDTQRVGRNDKDKMAWGDRGNKALCFLCMTRGWPCILEHKDSTGALDSQGLIQETDYSARPSSNPAFFYLAFPTQRCSPPFSTETDPPPWEGHRRKYCLPALKEALSNIPHIPSPQASGSTGKQRQEQHRYFSAPLNSLAGLEDTQRLPKEMKK